MDKIKKIESAWGWARDTRIVALSQKREQMALPRDPFEAQSGQEREFEMANRTIQALDTIMDELAAAHARTRGEAARRRTLRLLDIALIFGRVLLATLGIAAACITVQAPAPVTQASAVIGVALSLALSLAWAVKTAWK